MSELTFLNLCLCAFIILIILAWLNCVLFQFGYAQSANMPVTSKVIPYNSSAFPLTNKALHILLPKLSKVIPYNTSNFFQRNIEWEYFKTIRRRWVFGTDVR